LLIECGCSNIILQELKAKGLDPELEKLKEVPADEAIKQVKKKRKKGGDIHWTGKHSPH
jgi:hypothetical protein